MTSTSLRARQLAESLPAARIALPAEVAAAVRAFAAVRQMQMPTQAPPGQLVNTALWDTARQAVTDAGRTGSLTLDSRPLIAARAADAQQADLLTLARAVHEQAGLMLGEVVDAHADALTAAIQSRHGEVVAALAVTTRCLPVDICERVALDLGGEVREGYLLARDDAAELAALRGLLQEIRPRDAFTAVPGDLERAVAYDRSGWLAGHQRDVPDPPGSLLFYWRLLREVAPADAWCPAVGEVEARCGELREAARVARVQQTSRR